MINFSEYQTILEKFSIPISHVEDLIAVRIMTSSIGIGSDPLEQFMIPNSGDEVKATSSDGRILVSTETTHVHRSIV